MDLGEQPVCGLGTRFCLGEARGVGGVVLQILEDVVPVEFGKQAFDILLVGEGGWVGRVGFYLDGFGVRGGYIEEVGSASTVLETTARQMSSPS